jgi:hypothetical protein
MMVQVTVVRPVTFEIDLDENDSIQEQQSQIHAMAEELLESETFQIITSCEENPDLVE